jgi:N utilization substance protein A
MNTELLAILEYIEQERGISREVLLDALEKALVSAARKSVDQPATELNVSFDEKKGEFKVVAKLEVVESEPTVDQITADKAHTRYPHAKVGDVVEWEATPRNFGRIAAQAAKQAMMQQFRQAEKGIAFEEFKGQLGQIVNGIVRRYESGNLIIDLQKAEGVLTYKERIPGENYMAGDRISALLVDINTTGSGPSLILSRARPEFVQRLFEREVAEIHDGVVVIKAIAREAGSRTKIAVDSSDPHVDPIGACVGMRGMRVKNITGELGGERIDIIRYESDLKNFVASALQPATLKTITLDDREKAIYIVVEEDQLSAAIGRRGQNVRLTAKLVGWKVHITGAEKEVETSFEEQLAKAVSALAEKLQIAPELADKLVHGGFVTLEGLREVERADLESIEGITEAEIDQVLNAIAQLPA